MADDSTSPDDRLAQLLRDAAEAADVYIGGDTTRYLELVHHAPGFTLFAPTGGPATRHPNRAEEVRSFAGYFRGGEATLEHVETHIWGDTAVVVMIERQHGEVGDLPDQEWPLRVTHVYRHDGDQWLLVHRHADPLAQPIGIAEMSVIVHGPDARR